MSPTLDSAEGYKVFWSIVGARLAGAKHSGARLAERQPHEPRSCVVRVRREKRRKNIETGEQKERDRGAKKQDTVSRHTLQNTQNKATPKNGSFREWLPSWRGILMRGNGLNGFGRWSGESSYKNDKPVCCEQEFRGSTSIFYKECELNNPPNTVSVQKHSHRGGRTKRRSPHTRICGQKC